MATGATDPNGVFDTSPAIYGGTRVSTCEWPTVVYVDTHSGDCTGTLIHPRVVVSAAHCGAGAATIGFGESVNELSRTVSASCTRYPETGDWERDVLVCVLDEAVTDLPPTPPLTECEADQLVVGRDLHIVGFGSGGSAGARGIKRAARAPAIRVGARSIDVGESGISACHGDSGGPAFLELDDGSLRLAGIVHGRYDLGPFETEGQICGQWAGYVRVDSVIEWLEATSGFDLTPCLGARGQHEDGLSCGASAATPPGGGGQWAGDCGEVATGPATSPCPGADDRDGGVDSGPDAGAAGAAGSADLANGCNAAGGGDWLPGAVIVLLLAGAGRRRRAAGAGGLASPTSPVRQTPSRPSTSRSAAARIVCI